MTVEKVERIRRLLTAALAPVQLDVIDEGHKHAGHAGEGKGHFFARIVSPAFAGKNPIQRHRMVYDALGEMMPDGIHALSIEAKAPGE
ncbi:MULTISPECIES: BolA family protein [unclassified Luteibacter]|uniref:BolA family protein n=1 Tax=unclassified Luteibacter TaxID=2620188 RepID=UPI0008B15F6E|nr:MULTISPECIES: BolA family protein [unclassified Luteibacter]MDR6936154.1 BolA protein [Luteibacter sp. 3190]SEO56265.1 BolA protein [Luteibacter sp. UNC138MFCol5.1]SEV88185.1 transcriptional regulator, BolA protein family [Luteibacter sp. 329MFSha]